MLGKTNFITLDTYRHSIVKNVYLHKLFFWNLFPVVCLKFKIIIIDNQHDRECCVSISHVLLRDLKSKVCTLLTYSYINSVKTPAVGRLPIYTNILLINYVVLLAWLVEWRWFEYIFNNSFPFSVRLVVL